MVAICYDTNRRLQFEKARSALISSSLGNFKKPSEALAHINKLLQDANTAFGKQFITYYDLFILVKKDPCSEIRYEIDSILIDGDYTRVLSSPLIGTLLMIRSQRRGSSTQVRGYYDGILQLRDPDHPEQAQDATAPTMHAALHPSAHDLLSDRTLVCERLNEDDTTCGDSFVFRIAEQLQFEHLGYKSCPKHRGRKPRQNTPRAYAADKCNAGDNCNNADFHECREFKAGICRFGDECELSHSDTPTGHNTAMPDDIDLEDLADL